MKFEFEYIDRNKRLTARVLKLVFYVMAFVFLFVFWGYSKYSTKNETVFENLFSISKSLRIVGWIGFPLSILLNLYISRFISYKVGRVILSKHQIEVFNRNINHVFLINQIEELKLIKDIPYKGDERSETEKASRILFKSQGVKFDFEINIQSKAEFEDLSPIFKHWEKEISDYKVEYLI